MAVVKLIPSRDASGRMMLILMVGAKMVGSYPNVAAAKQALRAKYGSRFKESSSRVNPASSSWKTVSAFISSKGGNPRDFENAYHTSVNALMRTLSTAGIGYGLEYVREPLKAPYSNGLAYLNMGDPYAKTLLYVGVEPRGKYVVGNWGDIVEKYEKRRRNISMGITQGTGKARRFFPIRASADYDPTRLSGAEGKRARSGKRKAAKMRSASKQSGLKAIKSKSTVKTKLATKRRKAKKAVGLFGARALKKALPTSRRNPPLTNNRNVDLTITKVKLDRGGYSRSGQYYGIGAPVYGWSIYDNRTREGYDGEVRGSKAAALADAKRKAPHMFEREKVGAPLFAVAVYNSAGRKVSTVGNYKTEAEANRVRNEIYDHPQGHYYSPSRYDYVVEPVKAKIAVNPTGRHKSKGKRKVPAAFRAAAERAKAMTPAQRAAWAKKMQAARKAKRR